MMMRALIDVAKAKDFILKLLKSDPQERLTVQQAMDHPVRYQLGRIILLRIDAVDKKIPRKERRDARSRSLKRVARKLYIEQSSLEKGHITCYRTQSDESISRRVEGIVHPIRFRLGVVCYGE